MRGKPTITAKQFEREYAERCGVTVEWLRERGRVVRRCYCDDYEACEGWMSVNRESWEEDRDMRRGTWRPPQAKGLVPVAPNPKAPRV